MSGLSQTTLKVFAAVTPTTSATAKPGWLATAIAAMSSLVTLAEFKRLGYHGVYIFDVGARGDFGHDPAVFFVQFGLRCDDRRFDDRAVGDNRRSGLIATCLDTQDVNRFFGHNLDISPTAGGCQRSRARRSNCLQILLQTCGRENRDWNWFGEDKVGADVLRERVADDFDIIGICAAKADLFGGSDNGQLVGFEIYQVCCRRFRRPSGLFRR